MVTTQSTSHGVCGVMQSSGIPQRWFQNGVKVAVPFRLRAGVGRGVSQSGPGSAPRGTTQNPELLQAACTLPQVP